MEAILVIITAILIIIFFTIVIVSGAILSLKTLIEAIKENEIVDIFMCLVLLLAATILILMAIIEVAF